MSNQIKNSYLNKSGFFIVDENTPGVIDIQPHIHAKILLVNNKKPLTINLESHSKVEFFGLFQSDVPPKIFFHQNEEHSELTIKTLFLNWEKPLQSQIKSYIHANHCSSDVDIVWLIQDKHLHLDSVIEIEKDVQKIEAHLDIENIFTSWEWSVHSIPTLLVRSDDVIASHSSKTHTIDENKLFYLTARWLEAWQARLLMIQSYFAKIFEWLKDQKEVYQKMEDSFISWINI